MRELKVKGIVSRATPYNESDMIVTIVSVENGVLTATARGCLKPSAKLRYAASPFNFGDYVLACNKYGRYVITECEQIENFLPILNDIERYYAGCFALELLTKLCKQPAPSFFVSALRTLERLAYGDECADRLTTDLLLEALSKGGNALDFRRCAVCGCIIEDEAYFREADGIVCKHCKSNDCVPIDALSREYIVGTADIPHALRIKANLILTNLINNMQGVNINAGYFTEQI